MRATFNWRWPSSHKQVLLVVGYALVMIIFSSLGWLGVQQMRAEAEADRWENHTYQVLIELSDLLADLQAAETGERGFLVTGDEQYLAPYTAAVGRVEHHWAELRDLTVDNSRQQARLARIEPLLKSKLAELQHTIELRRTSGFAAAAAEVLSHKGKQWMDQLRQHIGRALADEQLLLSQRTAAKQAHRGQLELILLLGTAACVVLLGVLALAVSKEPTEVAVVNRSYWSRYGMAVGLTALTLLALQLLIPIYGDQPVPLVILTVAAAAAAWWGGLGPGLVTTVLCGLISLWLFVPPVHSFAVNNLGEGLRLLLTVFSGAVISALAEAMHRAVGRQRLATTQIQALFENMQDGFARCQMVYDNQGRPVDFIYLNVNPAFSRVTGLENVVGKRVTELLPVIQTTHPELLEVYGRVARTGQSERLEIEFTPLAIWLLLAVYRPHPGQFAVIFTDITERKRDEERLRLVNTALEAAANGIAITDRHGTMEWVNSAFTRLTGYSRAELIGQNSRLLKSGQQSPALYQTLWETILRGEPWQGQLVNRRKDGTLYPEEMTITPVRASDGAITHFVAIKEDITARKQAEADLRESEARFRTLANAIPQLAFIARPDGHIFWYNQRWYDYTGTTFEDMEGWGWQKVHDPSELPKVLDRWFSSIMTDEPFEMTFPLRGADGVFRPFLTRVIPLKDTTGRVVQWFGTNTDVSAFKQTEQALRASEAQLSASNTELDQKVRDRTTQLQATVTELEDFSYSIAHDMRAPLRAMRSFAELLQAECRTSLTARAHDYLNRIAVSAERMDHLIVDALDYTKALRTELPLSPVDPAALLRGMLESYPEFQPALADIQIAGPLPTVLANPAGLTQCFSNLLANAIKFVAADVTPQVRITAEVRGDRVRFWVTDNGIGIPPSMHQRIFDLFQRGSRHYDGTGIGLALVRKVTQRMGGQVGVESEPGHGSRFWIEFQGMKP